MRKLSAVILIVLSTVAFAKISNAQEARLEVRAGMNLANQSRDASDTKTLGTKVGFLGGLGFQYWFSPIFSINPQLLFDMKGVSEQAYSVVNPATHQPTNVTRDLAYNYVEIPILLHVNITKGDYRPYVFAGPTLGMFLSGSRKVVPSDEGVGSNLNSNTSIESSEMATPDLGLDFGAGIAYKMMYGPSFYLDAGYAMGLANEVKSGEDEPAKIRAKDIRIQLGIAFDLGAHRHQEW